MTVTGSRQGHGDSTTANTHTHTHTHTHTLLAKVSVDCSFKLLHIQLNQHHKLILLLMKLFLLSVLVPCKSSEPCVLKHMSLLDYSIHVHVHIFNEDYKFLIKITQACIENTTIATKL